MGLIAHIHPPGQDTDYQQMMQYIFLILANISFW